MIWLLSVNDHRRDSRPDAMLAINPRGAQIINEEEAYILEYENDPLQ
jgi:hypothetical protein